uniref:Small ribosomal subunit protein uS3m n=1 Tax=Lecanora saxigena TaxID=1585466 RepID=A0A482JYX9_9LECA|nr:ribosomal protein S3 [Lecanora saxigena]QBP39479.1 ribosomal protein S3 [Lecanora saxigena]
MNNLKTFNEKTSFANLQDRACNFNSKEKKYENTNLAPTLNLFNTKLKKHKWAKKENVEFKKNLAGKSKYFLPAHTEWFNSIYAYNQNTIKNLPVALKVTFKLLKSYFNLYSRKLETIKGSRRLFLRRKRLSSNRILISKPELKHTSEKISFVFYVYNRQKKYIYNKIKKIASLDNYLKHYVNKCLRKEIFSLYLRKSLYFNKCKFEERYILPISNLIKKVYNKEIEFHVVNLKYLYFNSHIFSEILVTKLKNRNNKLLRVLKSSLFNFKVPGMDRIAVYREMYNKKKILQNPKVVMENEMFDPADLDRDIDPSDNKDVLQFSFEKAELTDFSRKNSRREKSFSHYSLDMRNAILKLIKNKHVNGIRIEVAGRLSRRNTANRSVFKLAYKGSIRNMDSSYKGLSTVVSRGYAKSNLQYTNIKSKVRGGSFGLKGWVSSI